MPMPDHCGWRSAAIAWCGLAGETGVARFHRELGSSRRDSSWRMHVVRPSLALISWRGTRRRLRSSKTDCRRSLPVGSTTRSNSPAGIMFPLASFRRPQSMTIQLRRHNGGVGRLPDCRARIFILPSVQPRLRALSSLCLVNSFHASADSRKKKPPGGAAFPSVRNEPWSLSDSD
jgi:hypothetical protein